MRLHWRVHTGSQAMILAAGLWVFKIARETPVIVPPVPEPAKNASILPDVGLSPPTVDSIAAISSGPVVNSCARGLFGFLNWHRYTALGIVATSWSTTSATKCFPSVTSRLKPEIYVPKTLGSGAWTISAPNARRIGSLSVDMRWGTTMTVR